MNKNYNKLLNYFQTNGAVTRDTAVAIDDLQIENISKEELSRILEMMGTDFHKREDGNFWYEKTPVFEKGQLSQLIIALVICTIIVVFFRLFIF